MTDIVLKVSNHCGIRVKLVFILYATPLCKDMLSSMIIVPVIDQRNDQSQTVSLCRHDSIIHVPQSGLIKFPKRWLNTARTAYRDAQCMRTYHRRPHQMG